MSPAGSNLRRVRQPARRRGIALILVLVAAVVAFTISSAYLTSQSTSITIMRNAQNSAAARYVAESGLRLTIAYVQSSSTWRTDQTDGVWVTDQPFGAGTFTVTGWDGEDTDGDRVISQPAEGDGDVSDDANDLLTLEVVGKVGGAAHVLRAVVTPGGSSAPTPNHHWKLDETSGSSAADAVGGADGSLNSFFGTYWISGQVDGALSFDGSNDYVSLPSGCMVSSEWSLAFWSRPQSTSNYARLFLQGDNACGSRQIMVYWHNNHYEFRTSTSGSSGNPQAASGSITSNVWSHVVWVYDGSSHTIYVNGSPSSGSTTGSNVGIDGWNYVGRRGSGNYWEGDLDDIQLFDRALTSEEVGQVYDGTGYGGGGGGGGTSTVTALTSWTTGTTHNAQSGTNRLLIVTAGMEEDWDRTVTTARYGGQNLTQIATLQWGSGAEERIYMFYLDEAGIAAASGSTLQITWSGSTNDAFVAARMYANVDQSNPIRDFDSAYDNDGFPSTITAPPIDAESGDMVVAVAHCGDDQYYSWNNGLDEGTDQSGSTSRHSTADFAVTSSGSVTASATNNNPNRQGIIAATLRAATSSGSGTGSFTARWIK